MTTKLQEEFAKIRNSFQWIDDLASAIDADTRNTPDSRNKARHILRKSEEVFAQIRDIFKVDAKNPDAHLGAVRDAENCERVEKGK